MPSRSVRHWPLSGWRNEWCPTDDRFSQLNCYYWPAMRDTPRFRFRATSATHTSDSDLCVCSSSISHECSAKREENGVSNRIYGIPCDQLTCSITRFLSSVQHFRPCAVSWSNMSKLSNSFPYKLWMAAKSMSSLHKNRRNNSLYMGVSSNCFSLFNLSIMSCCSLSYGAKMQYNSANVIMRWRRSGTSAMIFESMTAW